MTFGKDSTNCDLANGLVIFGQNIQSADRLLIDEVIDRLRSRERVTVNREEIIWAVARGWCHDKTQATVMDIDLAQAIVIEVEAVLNKVIQT